MKRLATTLAILAAITFGAACNGKPSASPVAAAATTAANSNDTGNPATHFCNAPLTSGKRKGQQCKRKVRNGDYDGPDYLIACWQHRKASKAGK